MGRVIFNPGEVNQSFINLEIVTFLGYTGLRHRLYLAPDDGILFDMRERAYHSFWMKDVCISLDLIFIDHKRVVDIIAYTAPYSEYPLTPAVECTKILEVNAGWSRKHEIKRGTKTLIESY